jgi:hypothetical protein
MHDVPVARRAPWWCVFPQSVSLCKIRCISCPASHHCHRHTKHQCTSSVTPYYRPRYKANVCAVATQPSQQDPISLQPSLHLCKFFGGFENSKSIRRSELVRSAEDCSDEFLQPDNASVIESTMNCPQCLQASSRQIFQPETIFQSSQHNAQERPGHDSLLTTEPVYYPQTYQMSLPPYAWSIISQQLEQSMASPPSILVSHQQSLQPKRRNSQHPLSVRAIPLEALQTPQVPVESSFLPGLTAPTAKTKATPGPIPATTPLVLRQSKNGVQWIAFNYSLDRVTTEYKIRCDVESVSIEELTQEFKMSNCVYPRACCNRIKYEGNRLGYESMCNAVGWALAKLNPSLREKRGLIQRAVDSWRNSDQDPRLRSRRVRRMEKIQSREQAAITCCKLPKYNAVATHRVVHAGFNRCSFSRALTCD